jgi:hypothetical protein
LALHLDSLLRVVCDSKSIVFVQAMKRHTDLKRVDSMSDKQRKDQANGKSLLFQDEEGAKHRGSDKDSGRGSDKDRDKDKDRDRDKDNWAAADEQTRQLMGNDFDLCILLQEMLTSNLARENLDEETRQGKGWRPKNAFKDYSKLLTATLLPTHYVDAARSGQDRGWALADNGFDLYRAKVRCIGTKLADCDFGEPVFLDFEPLSTRVQLMCKLMIIIQGACLERAGPPKHVQDRCIQFDGDEESDEQRQRDRFRNNRIRSISCETLLSDTGKSLDRTLSTDLSRQNSLDRTLSTCRFALGLVVAEECKLCFGPVPTKCHFSL